MNVTEKSKLVCRRGWCMFKSWLQYEMTLI
jgi:hypothetical protein